MGFKILLDGEVVHETDDFVSGMNVSTVRGEAAAIRFDPLQAAVAITLTKATDGGYPDLDAREAANIKNLRASREGKVAGPPNETEADVRLSLKRAADVDEEKITDDFDLSSTKAPGITVTEDDRPVSEFREKQDVAAKNASVGTGTPAATTDTEVAGINPETGADVPATASVSTTTKKTTK